MKPCPKCGIPTINRNSFRSRAAAAIAAAKETGGDDREGVFRVLRYYGASLIEATDISLWAVRKAREEAEEAKAA